MLYGLNEEFAYPLLLNRPHLQPSRQPLQSLEGKRVMVTGAGGSIGSELVQQIATMRPAHLILLDQSEFALYEINCTLQENRVPFSVRSLIADVRHDFLMSYLFKNERPQIVFHAAALKHVPLLENDHNLIEAVRTNVQGTYNVAKLCSTWQVPLVLISTDKAVKPSSVMGLTKRVGELVALNEASDARGLQLAIVRFGNVLGSSGSVVPMFRRQIAQGGPVTVTHPSMTRYFMTIREAVSLVLRAADFHRDHEPWLYVLDMGEPVKIVDLAKQLITMAGLRVPEDIEIVFTGMRPGEKLNEELYYPHEELQRLVLPGVYGCPLKGCDLRDAVVELLEAANERMAGRVKELLLELEPSYSGAEVWA
jgi:FlaA1/EpsC-like NDP-sugar epimerase